MLTVQLGCKTEKRNSQCEYGQPIEQTRGVFCMCNSVLLAVNHKPVPLLADEFVVRSVLLVQVSLAAVNQINVIHERLQKSKDSLKSCFEDVNINVHVYPKVALSHLAETNAAERDISLVKFSNVWKLLHCKQKLQYIIFWKIQPACDDIFNYTVRHKLSIASIVF